MWMICNCKTTKTTKPRKLGILSHLGLTEKLKTE